MPSLFSIVVGLFAFAILSTAQTGDSTTSSAAASGTGYVGYNLTGTGDNSSAIYETANTGITEIPDPDVYLHAKVHVGEIDILVANLTAKVNLDAQVLQLLDFNAGVDVSINRVFLTIQNVSAEVLLEARLDNVLNMIGDVLDSLDLNPVLATLGQDLDNITSTVGGALTGSGSSSSSSNATVSKRNANIPDPSFEITHNILYSINDFSGNTHTNRILEQDGSIVDQSLDNDGRVTGQKVVGSYSKDMSHTGHTKSVTVNGEEATEMEYVYTPLPGVQVISAIYTSTAGSVLEARVLSEAFGGAGASIEGESRTSI